MPAGSSQLRTDARQNRDRILAAAREAFAERGIDVPIAAIARRAGVGVATLYRRFPTRESLVTHVFDEQFRHCAGLVDDALADPDPWRGFRVAVEEVCAMQVADRGFTAAFLTAFPDAVDVHEHRARAEAGFAEVVRRAKATGRLRADFHPDDLALVLLANDGLLAAAGPAAAAASRRLVAHLIRSFSTDGAGHLPPPAPIGLDHLGRTRWVPVRPAAGRVSP